MSEVLSQQAVTPSVAADAAARDFWTQAAGTPAKPVAVEVVAELVSDHLRAGLSRWVGLNGSSALLDRAVRLVAERHPALDGLSFLGGGAAQPTRGRAPSAKAVAAGMVALIAMVIELLGHLIGPEIAVSLVRQAVGPSARGVVGQSETGGDHG